jgi:putative heme-binding domain-containing protein
MEFGTEAKFPEKYQRACYAMDWTYGRILAVHMHPVGASYEATFETFLSGRQLNLTDLEIGRDGAMYFIVGGRGTQSGLYRVAYAGGTGGEPAESAQVDGASAKEKEAAKAARALRRQLETYHGRQSPEAVEQAWPHLDSPDRVIRYAARIAIESQPVQSWQQRALRESRLRARLTVLLAFARQGGSGVKREIVGKLNESWAQGLSSEERLEALRVYQVCFSRMGRIRPEQAKAVIDLLDPRYPSGDWRLDRELSQLLVYLQAPGVIEKTLFARDVAATQEEQVHYMVTLGEARRGWTPDSRLRFIAWFREEPTGEEKLSLPDGGTGEDFGKRTKQHPAELLRWFKEVGRNYADSGGMVKTTEDVRNKFFRRLKETERFRLAKFLAQKPTTTGRPKRVRAFVREWKMEDFVDDLDQVARARNFDSGREAFEDTQCLACHRFQNQGGAVGPDLTAVGSRFSRRDILESTLAPSKVLSEKYHHTTVLRGDGEEITGRLTGETEKTLTLEVNPLTRQKVSIQKKDIQTRSISPISPMPAGLVNVLSREEILDLVAYMEFAGQKDHAAFMQEAR